MTIGRNFYKKTKKTTKHSNSKNNDFKYFFIHLEIPFVFGREYKKR